MKRIIALIIAMLFCCSLCACKNTADTTTNTESTNPSQSEADAAPLPDEEYLLYKETDTETGAESVYKYNEDYRPVIKTVTSKGNSITCNYTYKNKSDGSYTAVIRSDLEKTLEEYNAAGLVTKRVLNYDTDSASTAIFKYNTTGKITEMKTDTLHETMEYDTLNHLVKRNSLDADGKTTSYIGYEYDENGKVIKQTKHEGDSSEVIFSCTWKLEYDKFGRLTSETKTDESGVSETITYEYDENGGLCRLTDNTLHVMYEYRPASQCMSD